ncbi:MAG: ABC transporter substrate-binding protein, partial [Christensenellaceae bacterium]
MRAKRRLAALLALLLLAVPLAACQGDGDQASSPVLVVATPTPKADLSTLHIVMPENVETLHPLRATQREVRSLLGLVYESLLTYDGEGNPTGGLAASLEPDETAKVWTVKLRTQASWQGSGRPLSADDVIFTLDLIRQIGEDGAYASVLDYLENWEKVDETTVRISCTHGFMGNQTALD